MTKKTIFDPVYKNMINELKNIRNSLGLKQRDLAKALDVPHCYVARYEICERRLDIIELIRILRIFKLSEKEISKFITNIIEQYSKNNF